METTPDITNLSYIDEYPHLAEKVRLRRLAAARPLGYAAVLSFPVDYREIMEAEPHADI